MNRRRLPSVLAAVAVTLTISACAGSGLGTLGDVLGSAQSNSLYGEVRSVDTRRGSIQVREQRGRDYTVRIDNRTRVLYQQREYSVSALERGDQVQVYVEYDRNNTAWADRIEVRESARDSRDRDRGDWDRDRGDRDRNDRDRNDRDRAAVMRLDGRVQGIDTRRGWFTVTQTRGPRLVVYVTRNTRSDEIRRFERLRRGDRVRVEVRSRGRDQAELIRFR